MTEMSAKIPKVALVMGGAQPLGRVTVLALAAQGFDVGIHCDRSRVGADDTLRQVQGLGRRAVLLQADLADEAQVERLIPLAAEKLGPVGVLINNAGRCDREAWDDVTRESWDAQMGANLRIPFVLIQAFARALVPPAEGVVINMLDQPVSSPAPYVVSYTISKAGLLAMTETMALALAPRIRVNAIGPAPAPALPTPRQIEAKFGQRVASVPFGPGISPEEVARTAIMILGSPGMTGQMVALDGGQHRQWVPARNLHARNAPMPNLPMPNLPMRNVPMRNVATPKE
jgi:NAD(P)-dependent dehydrogenase (short-subunit alcohol dehydrogenase family)